MAGVEEYVRMDIYKKDFSYKKFITELRAKYIGDKTEYLNGIPLLGGVPHRFVNVRIYFEETRFISTRFATEDVYFIGFSKGNDEDGVTRVLNALKDSNKKVEGLLESELKSNPKWSQVDLLFYNTYGSLGQCKKTNVSRLRMIKSMRDLYEYKPASPDADDKVKQGCQMICLLLAEPLRYQVLAKLIQVKFNGTSGYTFTQQDETIVTDWMELFTFLYWSTKELTDEQKKTWKTNEEKWVKLLKWYRKRPRVLILNQKDFPNFSGLLKRNKEAGEEAEEAARQAKAGRARGDKLAGSVRTTPTIR